MSSGMYFCCIVSYGMLNEHLNRKDLAIRISKSDANSFYSFCVDADNYAGKSLITAIFEAGKTNEHFTLLI